MFSTACTLAGVVVTQRFSTRNTQVSLEHQRRVAADDRLFDHRMSAYQTALKALARLDQVLNPMWFIKNSDGTKEARPLLPILAGHIGRPGPAEMVEVHQELTTISRSVDLFGTERVRTAFRQVVSATSHCTGAMFIAAHPDLLHDHEFAEADWLTFEPYLARIRQTSDELVEAIRSELHGEQ